MNIKICDFFQGAASPAATLASQVSVEAGRLAVISLQLSPNFHVLTSWPLTTPVKSTSSQASCLRCYWGRSFAYPGGKQVQGSWNVLIGLDQVQTWGLVKFNQLNQLRKHLLICIFGNFWIFRRCQLLVPTLPYPQDPSSLNPARSWI